jgi:(p)ppGpp synthase/HD superfamily hydrolase
MSDLNRPAFSSRYDAALTLAARAHRHQNRKGGDVPYIVHLVNVSVILIRYGFGEDVAIAGLLHDIVEDQSYAPARIQDEFGPVVAGIVAVLTENKREGGQPRPWEVRKQEALDHLRHADLDAVAVKAADALHTSRELAADLRRMGAAMWRNLSRGPGPSLWYFRSVAEIVGDRLGDHPLAAELDDAVRDLERASTEVEER